MSEYLGEVYIYIQASHSQVIFTIPYWDFTSAILVRRILQIQKIQFTHNELDTPIENNWWYKVIWKKKHVIPNNF